VRRAVRTLVEPGGTRTRLPQATFCKDLPAKSRFTTSINFDCEAVFLWFYDRLRAMSLAALLIALISLLVTIILGTKNYKKSKRLEYFHRQDHLFDKISELNATNSETRLISARYEIIRLKKLSLIIQGDDAEETNKQCDDIKEIIADKERTVAQRNDIIEGLHSIYKHLTSKTDATLVEQLIALVQVVSDKAKQNNDAHLATLHAFEESFPLMRDNLTEMNELKTRHAELKLEQAMKELILSRTEDGA
jgi:hypothetical protein